MPQLKPDRSCGKAGNGYVAQDIVAIEGRVGRAEHARTSWTIFEVASQHRTFGSLKHGCGGGARCRDRRAIAAHLLSRLIRKVSDLLQMTAISRSKIRARTIVGSSTVGRVAERSTMILDQSVSSGLSHHVLAQPSP